MAISTMTMDDGNSLTIRVTDRFDYSVHREFRESYRYHQQAGAQYRVDLSGATYMDSSALGMLLLLQEHAQQHRGNVVLVRPSAAIKKILDIANFHQLFAIEA